MATAYHVTPMENLESILEHGLVPMIGERSEKLGEVNPRVYLFPQADHVEDALSNWLGDELEDYDELAILEVDLIGYPYQFSVGYEISVSDTIKPNAIIKVFDENFNPITTTQQKP